MKRLYPFTHRAEVIPGRGTSTDDCLLLKGVIVAETRAVKTLHSIQPAKKARRRTWQRSSFFSPPRMVLLMATAIFVCEIFDMVLLYHLPPISPMLEAIIDASILLLLLTPFYLFFYCPFWQEHQQFSQEVRYLSRKLMDSIEMERKRLSHDLHDQCGQTLAALQIEMEVLRKGLDENDVQQQEQARLINSLATKLINDLREVIYQIRPAALDHMGLVQALHTLMADFSKSHPDIKVSEVCKVAEKKLNKLSEAEAVALYRICQEGLNNISKHAQATEASIQVGVSDSKVFLEITDNGIGFDVHQRGDDRERGPQGIGLLGIRERVAELGGKFSIVAEPGKGSNLSIELPIYAEGTNG